MKLKKEKKSFEKIEKLCKSEQWIIDRARVLYDETPEKIFK